MFSYEEQLPRITTYTTKMRIKLTVPCPRRRELFSDFANLFAQIEPAIKDSSDRCGSQRSSGHRVQDFESKMLGRQVCWIREQPRIDRTKGQIGLVLPQQHLTSTRANIAVFWKPSQAERTKKARAIEVRFEPRQRDMKQCVSGLENQRVSQPLFRDVWVG